MMEEVKVEPPNQPDAELKPEHWKFYDPELDAIKPEAEVHTFAENLTLEQKKQKDEDLRLKEAFEARNYQEADMNSYNPFERDTRLGPDFSKAEDRFPYEPEGLEYEKEGDVLVLDGEKPKKKIPGFDFEKQRGRFDDLLLDDQMQEDQLVIDPEKPKKIVNFVNMDKQVGRPETHLEEEDLDY